MYSILTKLTPRGMLLSGLDTPATKADEADDKNEYKELREDISLGSDKSASPPTMDADNVPYKPYPNNDAEEGKEISHDYITEAGDSFVGPVEKDTKPKREGSKTGRLGELCKDDVSSPTGGEKGTDTEKKTPIAGGDVTTPRTSSAPIRQTSKGSLLRQRSIKGKSMYAGGMADPLSSESKTDTASQSKSTPMDISAGLFDPLFNPPPAPPKEPWSSSLMLVVPLRLGKDTTDPENIHVC